MWSGRCATSRASIEAHGWKDGKLALSEKRETTGPVATLRLTADRTEIDADGEDVAVLKVEALDSGPRGAHRRQLIEFKVTGEGALIGVGNGDPNCQESDKGSKRSLFNGLAQVIVQATKQPGEIQIEARNLTRDQSVTPVTLVITTKPVQARPAVPEPRA